jgi:hypothetical protein
MKRLFLFIVLLTTILVVKAQSEESITWTPKNPHVGETVYFTFNTSVNYNAERLVWYFSDDQSGNTTGFTCTHKYTQSGEQGVGIYNNGTRWLTAYIEVLPSNSIEEPVEITYKKEYQIYDVTGKFIGNNIKVLKNGIYFIRQKIDDKYLIKKIIILNSFIF